MKIDEIRKMHYTQKGKEEGVDYTIQILKYLKENKSIEEIEKFC